MSIRTVVMSLIALFVLTLQGCIAITGEPRKEMIMQDVEYTKADSTNAFYQSLSAGEMLYFSGTSHFTFSFNTSPNLSKERASDIINTALKEANMYNENSHYSVNAEVISDGSCGELYSGCDGNIYRVTREVSVKYTVVDNVGNIIASKVITTDGTKKNFDTTLLKERRAAEIAYKRNLIEMINYLKERGDSL